METARRQWLERYANRLNEGQGDLSKLSSAERKHLRMLIREYELEQQLTDIQNTLSQGELPLDETGDKGSLS